MKPKFLLKNRNLNIKKLALQVNSIIPNEGFVSLLRSGGLLLAFLTVFTTSVSAQSINWLTIEEALALQKKEPKKIMIDMYTNWCGPCKLLDKNTFSNKDIAEFVNANYYPVKFNAEGNETVTFKNNTYNNPNYDPARANNRNSVHEFSQFLRVSAYPTIVFLDEKADLITPLVGYKTPQQLELFLKLFSKSEYMKIDTQDKFKAYYETFEPKFSN